MDPVRFDTLVKSLSTPGTRRAVVRLLAALPLAGALAMFAPGGAAARCRGARRCGRRNCCAKAEVCGDREAKRCAPRCDDACFTRTGCGCAATFDTDRSYCNVNPTDFGALCAEPACDSHEDCAPDGFCSNVTCGEQTTRCLAACPAE